LPVYNRRDHCGGGNIFSAVGGGATVDL